MAKINKLIIFGVALSIFGVSFADVEIVNERSDYYVSASVNSIQPSIKGGCAIIMVPPCASGQCSTKSYQPGSSQPADCISGPHDFTLEVNRVFVSSVSIDVSPTCNTVITFTKSGVKTSKPTGECNNSLR